MKHVLVPVVVAFLFTACSGPDVDQGATEGTDSTAVPPAAPDAVANWPGFYSGTLPCADCPGIDTRLWVRSDSTFVLQQLYIDRDSVPQGTIGQWHVVNGLMTIGYAGDKPDFYRYTETGLLMVDEMGEMFASKANYGLEKLADGIGDAIPRMRVTGTFTYMADAQSFKPCGSAFNWPCVGGMDMGEEEGEPLVKFTNLDLQRAYAKGVKTGGDPWVIEVICTMGMGPAMEGDGADEYLFVEQVVKPIGQCP